VDVLARVDHRRREDIRRMENIHHLDTVMLSPMGIGTGHFKLVKKDWSQSTLVLATSKPLSPNLWTKSHALDIFTRTAHCENFDCFTWMANRQPSRTKAHSTFRI
jgi:S-ribosylhomocysteine lyase LuxS involved in autoinducer biosynthesis